MICTVISSLIGQSVISRFCAPPWRKPLRRPMTPSPARAVSQADRCAFQSRSDNFVLYGQYILDRKPCPPVTRRAKRRGTKRCERDATLEAPTKTTTKVINKRPSPKFPDGSKTKGDEAKKAVHRRVLLRLRCHTISRDCTFKQDKMSETVSSSIQTFGDRWKAIEPIFYAMSRHRRGFLVMARNEA